MRMLIRLSPKDLMEVSEALKRLFELEGEEDIPIRLDGALRMLLSERCRFT